jgi:paraquat-inducible protein A
MHKLDTRRAHHRTLLACPVCDALQYAPRRGTARFEVRCSHCGALLRYIAPSSLERTLAYAVTALVLFVISNFFPILGLSLGESRSEVLLLGAIQSLFNEGDRALAGLVAFTALLVPAIELIASIYLLLPLSLGRVPRYFAPVFRVVHAFQPWGMVEVLMLGVLVSLVKLGKVADVLPGVALWSYGALMVFMAAEAFTFNPAELWDRVEALSGHAIRSSAPVPHTLGGRATASRYGLLACPVCQQLNRRHGASGMQHHCMRCGARLSSRKPYSLIRSSCFLLIAAVSYLPANMLPIMETRTFFLRTSDTILSGIVYLWQHDSWPLALLVFFASVVVPLLKLVVLGFLLVTIAMRSRWRALARSRLYRFIESIGRWSMLDIYVVTLLATLVQLGGLGSVNVGTGAAAFALVVVCTMFAAQSLDPRLIWDPSDTHEPDASTEQVTHPA